jgi:hypothetical protein
MWGLAARQDVPGETRGVRGSSRIARMLPAEAMVLNHPRLRLVWHARHGERTLLTCEDDDRMQEVVRRELPVWRPSPRRVPDRQGTCRGRSVVSWGGAC